jgi:hypothetical protein
MKYIPNWQEKKLTCYFCGEKRSVKYVVEEYDRFKQDEPFEVCACNKCALLHSTLDK